MKKISKILIAAGALLCAVLVLSCVTYIVGADLFILFDSGSYFGQYLALEGEYFLVNLLFVINYLVSAVGCLGVPVLIAGFVVKELFSDESDLIKKISKILVSSGTVLCGFLLLSVIMLILGDLFGGYGNYYYYYSYFEKLWSSAPILGIVMTLNQLAIFVGALGVPMVALGVAANAVSELGLLDKKEKATAEPAKTEE